jgi:mRNA-degrading endonuclease toxin of MazEF toxin-antitoxin module
VYTFQVLIGACLESGLAAESKALVEQLRAIEIKRVRVRCGVVTSTGLAAIDAPLRLHLAL